MTILRYLESVVNLRLDNVAAAIGASGKLKLYTGTIPTHVASALGAQVLLASLTCSSPSFAASAATHTLTGNTIASDASADSSGTVAWGTITTSADTRIVDFDVGTTGTSMIIDTTSINMGQVVSCSSFVITGGNW